MKQNSKESVKDGEKQSVDPNEQSGSALAQARPSQQQFNVVRRIYQREKLNQDAEYHELDRPWRYHAKKVIQSCGYYECLLNSLPIIKWLPKYKVKQFLMGDVIAGATTAVMHIPQGMGYALLAEVPPIVGLYMAFFPVLIYVLLGTSPHISMGTFAVGCLMTGKVVSHHASPVEFLNGTTQFIEPLAAGVKYTPLEVVSVVTFAVGLIETIMWILRLGAVSTLLSDPLVSGFTTAASFQLLCTQLKDLFGVVLPKIPSKFNTIYIIIEICKLIPTINIAALIISILSCVILILNNELFKPWLAKKCPIPVPIELIVIITGTLVARFGHLKKHFGVSLVGHIPTGLPKPKVPPLKLMPQIMIDSFTITMVTYTISMSLALIFASKDKYEIDANQELLAMGAGNLFGCFFFCAPFCASLSRSYIQYQAGAKTGLTMVVSAMLVLLVLLWIGPFFEMLPRSVLSSIIVVSLKGMFLQVKDLKKFWMLSKLDAAVWIVTFLITFIVDIDIGLFVGLFASLGALFIRSQKPYTCLLGRVLSTDLYLDIKRYRGAEEIPGVKIFHYCGGLNFATKNLFRSTIFRKVGIIKPVTTKQQAQEEDNTLSNVRCVIIDVTSLSYVDAPGVKMLVTVEKEFVNNNMTVLLAGANSPVTEMIRRYNRLEEEPLQLLEFSTVHDAVVYWKMLESEMAKKDTKDKDDKGNKDDKNKKNDDKDKDNRKDNDDKNTDHDKNDKKDKNVKNDENDKIDKNDKDGKNDKDDKDDNNGKNSKNDNVGITINP